jgi:hypothetical protein
LRISLRRAGAELEAEQIVEGLGTNVKRQVKMGTSEIDYEVTIAGKPRGFEVKGWTADTWEEALDAAIKRLNKKGLTAAEKKGVQKIDHMLGQLQNAQAAKGASPYLGITDALNKSGRDKLARLLKTEGLGGTEVVTISEAKMKEAAAGRIGESLGIPRP